MRFVLTLFAALSVSGAALAQDPQVLIETRLAEVVRLDFDLGFSLSCDHSVEFLIQNPTLLQPYDPPASTRGQSFEFMVGGFGTTDVTVNFTGVGGGCVGAGSDTLQVTLQPDLSAEVKLFGSNAKALSKTGKTLKRNELARLQSELNGILADFGDGFLSTNGAIAELIGATAASQAFVAAELAGDLGDLAAGGSSLVQSAGGLVLPVAFQSGAKGSTWDAALGSSQACYQGFVFDAADLLCDALDRLAALDEGASLRTTVRLQRDFPLVVVGPRLVGDPDDDPVTPPGWLALVAWNGANGSGLIGVGDGVSGGGPNGKVRLVGPAGRDETATLPFTSSPRQNLLVLITPQIVSDPLTSNLSALALTPAPGNWRLELRYEADTNPADLTQITAP